VYERTFVTRNGLSEGKIRFHIQELYNLYSLPNISRAIKSVKRHEGHTGEARENQGIDTKIILN
jgi:hypothetical protein